MRKVIGIVIIATICSSLISLGILYKGLAYFRDKDYNYSNSEFGFSLTLPNQPIAKSEQSYSNGLLFKRTTIKSIGADKSEYTIVCTNLPVDYLDSSDVYEQLQNGLDFSIKTNGLELIKSIDTLINNYPAIYSVTKKSNHTMVMLSIIKSNQSIILSGVIYYDLLQRQHFEHYLNSIKIES